jgi:hypothetical protein
MGRFDRFSDLRTNLNLGPQLIAERTLEVAMSEQDQGATTDIAVIGMALRVPS